jgi:butyrate kinase
MKKSVVLDKEEILNVALKVFTRYGYEGTNVADIAHELGATRTRTPIYYYFKNKTDLYEKTVQRYLEKKVRQYNDIFISKLPFFEQIHKDLAVCASSIFSEQILFSGIDTNKKLKAANKLRKDAFAALYNMKISRVLTAIDQGEIRPETDVNEFMAYLYIMSCGLTEVSKRSDIQIDKSILANVVDNIVNSFIQRYSLSELKRGKGMYKILVLNLGSTSSKVAIYHDKTCIADHTIRHSVEDMQKHPLGKDQLSFRKKLILDWLRENGAAIEDFDAIAGRGANTDEGARTGGTYLVDENYAKALLGKFDPEIPIIHGIRLVAPMALEFARVKGIPFYITDPTSVDEMRPIARTSGFAAYERKPGFHPLNHKAVARKYAQSVGKDYNELRLIVAHMGGGVSVGAHCCGKVIDANDCADGYGPFSPERAGTVSAGVMLDICFSGKYTKQEIYHQIRAASGVFSHLGTKDMKEVETRVAGGDKKAALVFEALAYNIAKEIGQCYVALECDCEAIIFTGGMAYSKLLMEYIKKYAGKLAPFVMYPGEFENEALAFGAYRVLSGQEWHMVYGSPEARGPERKSLNTI